MCGAAPSGKAQQQQRLLFESPGRQLLAEPVRLKTRSVLRRQGGLGDQDESSSTFAGDVGGRFKNGAQAACTYLQHPHTWLGCCQALRPWNANLGAGDNRGQRERMGKRSEKSSGRIGNTQAELKSKREGFLLSLNLHILYGDYVFYRQREGLKINYSKHLC